MKLDYDWLLKAYNLRIEECMYKWKRIEELEEENKKLNIKVASLEWEIKWLNSVIDKLREELSAYDREYFDEDMKAKNIYKTQYEHSMWADDELIYEEWLYD